LVLGCWLRSLAARWRGQRPPAIGRIYLWSLAAAVLAFWVLRNLPHPLFAWLAPG
ncbi:MAG: DUF2752 domain-containing protein, partial [Armatimonadetes bacterium]|nr:DUF2752 domain-containing protein [Armatimonadota bacterium]